MASSAEIARADRAELLLFGARMRKAGSSPIWQKAETVLATILDNINAFFAGTVAYEPAALLSFIHGICPEKDTAQLLECMKELMNTLSKHSRAQVNHILTRAILNTKLSLLTAEWCLDRAAAEASLQSAPTRNAAYVLAWRLIRRLVQFEEHQEKDRGIILDYFRTSHHAKNDPRAFLRDLRAALMSYDDMNLTRRVVVVLRLAIMGTEFHTPAFVEFFPY